MLWPVSARFESAVAGATVKSATMNAIQDAIIGIFGGTLSIKQMLVDAVGDAAVSLAAGTIAKITGGALELDGATGDDQPCITAPTLPTARKLLLKAKVTATTYLRLYYTINGHLRWTVNAGWVPGSTWWAYDDFGSTAWEFEAGANTGWTAATYGGADHWADGAWSAFGALSSIGDLVLSGKITIATALGTGGLAKLGLLYTDLIPVAWGNFTAAGAGAATVHKAVGCSIARTGAGTFTVTFASALPGGTKVSAHPVLGGTAVGTQWAGLTAVVLNPQSNTSVQIGVTSSTGIFTDGTYDIHFDVFAG